MVALNKVIPNYNHLISMYQNGLSIPDISYETEKSRSSIRYHLHNAGVLRSRKESLTLASKQGKLSSRKGIKRTLTQEHKDNISKAQRGKGKGYSKKPNGYIEYTMGPNKFKAVHTILMQEHIGRKLKSNECVHHIDKNRSNNDISNLRLMTRSEHARLHILERIKERSLLKNSDKKKEINNGIS